MYELLRKYRMLSVCIQFTTQSLQRNYRTFVAEQAPTSYACFFAAVDQREKAFDESEGYRSGCV